MDLIDRQAAIKALDATITITGEKNALEVSDYIKTVKERLEELPSAEPEIIRCKDCIYRRDAACDYVDFWLQDDYFCSRGERKDG